MRYPLLWERANASGADGWRHAEQRLPQLRALGITPIVGLVHHGSGPHADGLMCGEFAAGLARHAGAVARRFPWIEWYTPVNEPLTTARFSGLYGHWHPHRRDARSFARMLMNQCRGIVLAMRSVRAINPGAKFVQTEDLGTIYATAQLAHQARFENERRWLTWDLLCGRVDAAHPLYEHLLAWGVPADELGWLRDHPCPPQVVGIDHYVTSDRFLDEDLARYPQRFHGGNAREQYADVEAVRVLSRPGTSLRQVMLEAASRYGLPVALTEIHLGCDDPRQQVHWLREAWAIAGQLEASGVNIAAVTAWALLGSYDWDTLMTSGGDRYEAGAFDVSGGELRATPLAEYIATLTGRAWATHKCASGTGWWHEPGRLIHGAPMPVVHNA